MRIDLLGLTLEQALACLEGEGVSPEIRWTEAPRRADAPRGCARVVWASDDASSLTVSHFLDPLTENGQNAE